jgi:hypothetical protein
MLLSTLIETTIFHYAKQAIREKELMEWQVRLMLLLYMNETLKNT